MVADDNVDEACRESLGEVNELARPVATASSMPLWVITTTTFAPA